MESANGLDGFKVESTTGDTFDPEFDEGLRINSALNSGGSARLEDDTAGLLALHHCPSMRHRKSLVIDADDTLQKLTSEFHMREAKVFTTAEEAVEYAKRLYDGSCQIIHDGLRDFANGKPSVAERTQHATYPMVATHVDIRSMDRVRGHYAAYGIVKEPGFYGCTLTRFDVLEKYYLEQLELLVERYGVLLVVGATSTCIPLPFVMDLQPHDISSKKQYELHENFTFPDLTRINDDLPNGTVKTNLRDLPRMRPLSLFTAERIDLGLQRLEHYCSNSAKHFQGFILLTNYQRYVSEFIVWALSELERSDSGFLQLVGPHDRILADHKGCRDPEPCDEKLPQMPAWHLTRADGTGITVINIGVGPSNAKTITDHLAVLRPHCWLMLGHCAGLRMSQNLGDYVLAHAYVRLDHVLDQELPLWVPLPPIAEVQTALEQAVSSVLRASGVEDVKSAMRTGTLVTTDNRDWELGVHDFKEKFTQSRAVGVDMESATIAANGFRFRVPYGTLLCVSDKPVHGELKLKGMANEFYRQRVAEHLKIGLEAIRLLRDLGVQRLQSRKLRGFDEPPFR